MSDISLSGSNIRLSYNAEGSHIALFRCKQLTSSYGVVSEESHARTHRAFYPHLRIQGLFSITLDFIHWHEYNTGMRWFRDYFSSILGSSNSTTSPMSVQLDARDFSRLGIPTSGVTYGDHVGSMVFSPTINFVSVSDPRDTKAGLLKSGDASHSLPSKDPDQVQWFYPESTMNQPGKLAAYLYDAVLQSNAIRTAALQDIITGTPSPPLVSPASPSILPSILPSPTYPGVTYPGTTSLGR